MSDRTPIRLPIRRALLGVYDKTGVEELAAGLAVAGAQLVPAALRRDSLT